MQRHASDYINKYYLLPLPLIVSRTTMSYVILLAILSYDV